MPLTLHDSQKITWKLRDTAESPAFRIPRGPRYDPSPSSCLWMNIEPDGRSGIAVSNVCKVLLSPGNLTRVAAFTTTSEQSSRTRLHS